MVATCRVKGLHGHCPPNCFREVRDATLQMFYEHLRVSRRLIPSPAFDRVLILGE